MQPIILLKKEAKSGRIRNGMDVTKKGYKLLMLVFERDTIIYSVTAAAVATLAMLVKNLSHDK